MDIELAMSTPVKKVLPASLLGMWNLDVSVDAELSLVQYSSGASPAEVSIETGSRGHPKQLHSVGVSNDSRSGTNDERLFGLTNGSIDLHTGLLWAEPWMRRSLSEQNVRSYKFERISSSNLKRLIQRTEQTMSDSLASSTIRNYATTWIQFREFALRHLNMPMNEESAVLYLQYRMDSPMNGNRLAIQSVLQYAKNLQAVASRLESPWEGHLLRSFMQSLVNQGARIPENQACVVSKDHFWNSWETIQWEPEERWVIYLMWKTASRWDDVCQLRPRDVYAWRTYAMVRWTPLRRGRRQGAGRERCRLKGDFHGVGWGVLVEDRRINELLRFARTKQDQEKDYLFELTATQCERSLKRISQDLTLHSMKRSALNVLVDYGIAAESLTKLSKHRDKAREIPLNLRTYLKPEGLAFALKTHELTRLL